MRTYIMNIESIVSSLKGCRVGSEILIEGYVRSDGTVLDVRVELVSDTWYQEARQSSLEILKDATIPTFLDFNLHDIEAARETLVDRLSKSSVGGPELNLPSTDRFLTDGEAVYLARLKLIGEPRAWDPPKKKPAALCIQEISFRADLPVVYYLHRLKLAEGKVAKVTVIR